MLLLAQQIAEDLHILFDLIGMCWLAFPGQSFHHSFALYLFISLIIIVFFFFFLFFFQVICLWKNCMKMVGNSLLEEILLR